LSELQKHKFETRFGAEAKIELVEWYGKLAIRKTRIPKEYRSPALDHKLRTTRTKAEAELLHAARIVGVDVPEVYYANPETTEIVMEFSQGNLLKNIRDKKLGCHIFETLGAFAARLHTNGIIHGDLTTKNVIHSNGRTVLIDFGLAFFSDRLEDKAEDMHLLKQAIKSSGAQNSVFFDSAMKGYAEESGAKSALRVGSHILEIERRGRYARVD
jgi:TP53 regulating kinase and related kinases